MTNMMNAAHQLLDAFPEYLYDHFIEDEREAYAPKVCTKGWRVLVRHSDGVYVPQRTYKQGDKTILMEFGEYTDPVEARIRLIQEWENYLDC